MVAIDYKLVMQGLMNNLFPMEELQLHNRYLHWGEGLIPITLRCLSSYNSLKCLWVWVPQSLTSIWNGKRDSRQQNHQVRLVSTSPQLKNLLIGEDIYVFEQKFLEKVKTMVAIDYKLVMQGLMNNLFPMEELQLHNRYLHWGEGLIPITLRCLSSYNSLKCLWVWVPQSLTSIWNGNRDSRQQNHQVRLVSTSPQLKETVTHSGIWHGLQDSQRPCRFMQDPKDVQ